MISGLESYFDESNDLRIATKPFDQNQAPARATAPLITAARPSVIAIWLLNYEPEPLDHGACANVHQGWSFQPQPLADGAFWSGADFVGLIGLNQDWLKRDPRFARRPR